MVETSDNLSQIDTLRKKLKTLPKKYLFELIKSLDIKFKDRSKANKETMISNILNTITQGTLTANDIEKELSKEKYKVLIKTKKTEHLTKKDLEDFRKEVLLEIKKFYIIRSKLVDLEDRVQIIDDKISHQSEMLVSLQRIVDPSYDKFSIQNLMKTIRRLNLDISEPKDFDNNLNNILSKGIKLDEFVKIGNMAITISELNALVKKITWPEDLDLFYDTVKAEFLGMVKETGSTIPIYKMKEVINRKLAISDTDFERQLINCFKKGWLTLDFRSPIGEEHSEFLNVDGRKYYIIRNLLKR